MFTFQGDSSQTLNTFPGFKNLQAAYFAFKKIYIHVKGAEKESHDLRKGEWQCKGSPFAPGKINFFLFQCILTLTETGIK